MDSARSLMLPILLMSLTDWGFAATFTVTTTADSGPGSLRQAILDANAAVGVPDTIVFDIPPNDPGRFYYQDDGVAGQVTASATSTTNEIDEFSIADIDPDWPRIWNSIRPQSALPEITDPVTIDGYTQSGAIPNSNPVGQGLSTILRVEIDGSAVGPGAPGITLADPIGPTEILGLAVNRFPAAGVLILNSTNAHVGGCFLGTGPEGRIPLPNGLEGVVVAGGSDNRIGGRDSADRNLISGNTAQGIVIVRSAEEFTVANRVQGNLIGSDVTGAAQVANGRVGILIALAHDTVVGGTEEGAANLVSGNLLGGVELGNGAERTRIVGNRIGTNVTGTTTLDGGGPGVSLSSSFPPAVDNLIGGPEPGMGNLIGGVRFGVQIQGGTTRTLIQGNFIGTDATGSINLGNTTAGVQNFSPGNEIIGNLIANNGLAGIGLNGSCRVEGNTIFSNTLGIDVSAGNGSLITQNSIFDNSSLGIELRTSSTNSGPNFPQDPGDADFGGNGLQNFPILSSVALEGEGVRVEGSLCSMPDSSYRIEFFANASQHPTGFGEGRTYLGFVETTTDAQGDVDFSVLLPALPPGLGLVTCTATDLTIRPPETTPANNTSEFSPALAVEGQGFTVTTTSPGDGFGTLNAAIRSANNTAGVQTITFNIPPDDPGHVYYRDDGIPGQVSPNNVTHTTEAEDANISDIDPDWPHSWWSIKPLGQIEEITEPVVIDGYTQPGSIENTNAIGEGLDSILRIEIDGLLAVEDVLLTRSGFMRVTAGDCVLRGLVLNRTPGPKIQLDGVFAGGDGNRIEGCYLGPDVSGSLAFPPVNATDVVFVDHAGVTINSSSSNLIGGVDPATRNLISGNTGGVSAGVFLRGFFSRQNRIQGNLIGTDRSGTKALGIGQFGVRVGGVSDNLVGGDDPSEGNLIAGNSTGVEIGGREARRNRVTGNWIGTDPTGTLTLGNDGPGVWIRDSPTRSVIDKNTIAHNTTGVLLTTSSNVSHATGNLITRNSIHSNLESGIAFTSSGSPIPNDVPPESDPPDQDVGPNDLQNFPVLTSVSESPGGALIEGFLQSTPNSDFRIEFFSNREREENLFFPWTPGQFAEGETYLDSVTVSTDAEGMATFSHEIPPIDTVQPFITATATDVTDRGEGPANNTSQFSFVEPLGGCQFVVTRTDDVGVGTLREAVFCANLTEGSQMIRFDIPPGDPRHFYYRDDGVPGQVSIESVATSSEADDAAISDIDPDWPHSWWSVRPTRPLPNLIEGLALDGYSQPGRQTNTIPAPGGLDSVLRIEIDGSEVEGDAFDFRVGAELSLVQGLVVNRFGGNGVNLDTFGGNRVQGNYLGTDVSGSLLLGNGGAGVALRGERVNRIGGLTPPARNLIAGNQAFEIDSTGSGADILQGNLIGTDRSGQRVLRHPEGGPAVSLEGTSFASVGGAEPGAGNVIVSDGTDAVFILTTEISLPKQANGPFEEIVNCRSPLLLVQQAREVFFGTNDPGDFDLLDIRINSFLACIVFQGFIGEARGNAILGNRIVVSGEGLGIDLGGDGPTENDPGDSDKGANGMQNHPILETAVSEEGTTVITGVLSSFPETDYRIEFFSSGGAGRCAGEGFLGALEVLTEADGEVEFAFLPDAPVQPGRFVTSTATLLIDLDDDPETPFAPLETSEFSPCIPVEGEGAPCPQPYPDFNDDGVVDARDLSKLVEGFRSGTATYDLTGDERVDDWDFLLFSLSWKRPDCAAR